MGTVLGARIVHCDPLHVLFSRAVTAMPRLLSVFRRIPMTLAIASVLSACGGDTPTETNALAGSYRATTFRVTPSGQSAIDVLAQSGTLTITIGADNATSGSLFLPASVTGGTALTESMTGTAVRTGNSLQFQQAADTFVRNLTWAVSGNTLTVVDQTAGSARFTITLARQ
jgi:hypothetical protein